MAQPKKTASVKKNAPKTILKKASSKKLEFKKMGDLTMAGKGRLKG